MTDTRLHIATLNPRRGDVRSERSLCGLLVGEPHARRFMSAYPSEVKHAIHSSGDVCAECSAFYQRWAADFDGDRYCGVCDDNGHDASEHSDDQLMRS